VLVSSVQEASNHTEPVKETFLTCSCLHNASLNDGVLASEVGRTLKTPGANPACVARCARVRAVNGVSGDGFAIMVQPAASAAHAFRMIMLKVRV